jgi:hypothetical protein
MRLSGFQDGQGVSYADYFTCCLFNGDDCA